MCGVIVCRMGLLGGFVRLGMGGESCGGEMEAGEW